MEMENADVCCGLADILGKVSRDLSGILDNKIEMIEKTAPTRLSPATPLPHADRRPLVAHRIDGADEAPCRSIGFPGMSMTHATSETFDRNARAALADPVLHGALRNLADSFVIRRRDAIASLDDWEGLRERARSIKEETLLHLDEYLERFTDNAEKAGAKIHWARDGKEACEIVIGLVRAKKAAMVVKAKSMTGEEIHLNEALEEAGIEPVETDLGEWIIQLAGETPSHIVVPAIPKTSNDRRAFCRKDRH